MDNLPDALLCSIISLLPLREAVRTSIIARRWRPLWSFVPHVDFDMQLMTKQCKDCSAEVQKLQDHSPSNHLTKHALSVMDKIISTHQSKITSCQIVLPSFNSDYNEVNEWIEYLTKRKAIQELTLKWKPTFLNKRLNKKLKLPSSIFSYGTIHTLDLTYFEFRNASNFEVCKNIRTLKLNSVLLTDEVVDEINQWKLLENLSLSSCTGITKLKICCQNLKNLELNGLTVTEIEIHANELTGLVLEDVPCCVNNMAINTPRLTAFNVHKVNNLNDEDFEEIIHSWKFLEKMTLSCIDITKLNICHHNLKVLELYNLVISEIEVHAKELAVLVLNIITFPNKNIVMNTPKLVVFRANGISNLRDEHTDEIIRNSKFLENISLSNCYSIERQKICHQNLKVLELKGLRVTEIEICAKELSVLVIDNISCSIKDMVINTPNLIELRAYGKSLYGRPNYLTPAGILEHNSGLFESQSGSCYQLSCNHRCCLSPFENLRTLSVNLDLNNIREAVILSFILRAFTHLEKLAITIEDSKAISGAGVESPLLPYSEYKFWDRSESSRSTSYNLKFVEIHGYRNKALEFGFYKHLVTKAAAMKKISIHFYDKSSEEDTIASSGLLLLLPRASINVAIVFISSREKRILSAPVMWPSII